jgi:hypothetical protein
VKVFRLKSQIKVTFVFLFHSIRIASAAPQSLNRAELARVNAARAQSRQIVEGFSDRITELSRQAATPVFNTLQIQLLDRIIKEAEAQLALAIAGAVPDLALLNLLTDIASTLIVPITTTTYVCSRYKFLKQSDSSETLPK